ncbi:MAG: proline iminopeptidase-family hydrolase [Alphaproteobacteria bacterium]|nr:proline iminopeptidase-family hydrolase [Alphaproteobacteria bacterium]
MWFFKKPKCISKRGKISLRWGKIWYELTGSTQNAPLVVLHGGPGFPHNYLRSLLKLSDARAILFYDQLGCGRSDRSDDVALWNTERFADELDLLVKKLGLKEYHLLGHSWGAALALEHALRRPQGLKSAIMASPFLSAPLWTKDMIVWRDALPTEIRDILERCERLNSFRSEEFAFATQYFYARHVYRNVSPQHPDYQEAAKGMGSSVYTTMWGPSEFIFTGNLKNYDQTGRLHELTIPTLLTCGQWDEARPSTVEYYKSLIPGAQMKVFEKSSHMPHLEETELYMQTVKEFLKDV